MAQNKVHLTCGSKLFIENAVDSGVFIEVEDVTTLGGEIGQTGTFLESTTITDCAKDYISGLKDSPDLVISYLYSPTTNQNNFRTASEAGEKRAVKIEFADDGGTPVATVNFKMAMSGFTMADPAPDTILTANVMGKGSNFVWS